MKISRWTKISHIRVKTKDIYSGKRITHLEDTTIINLYVLYNGASKCMMKTLAEFKREIENFINTVRDLTNLFQQLIRKKVSKQ